MHLVKTDVPPITSWSHSRLGEFQKCGYRAYLLQVQKVEEPQRELPKGKTEHANDRGTRIHQSCEDFVTGKSNHLDPDAAKHFGAELEDLRLFHKEGIVSLEGEWGMSREWTPWNWYGQWVDVSGGDQDVIITNHAKTLPSKGRASEVWKIGKKLFTWVPAWLRLKLDALVFPSKYEAIAIDYKTGRKYGNEVKHGEQLQLYQLVTFLRYPELQEVTAELWYFDQDEITQTRYRRDQGLRFQRSWDQKGEKMTTCTEFKANPNIHSCRYCMLGPWEGATGHCQVGRR